MIDRWAGEGQRRILKRYLLDTNALSEVSKKVPSDSFMRWFTSVDEIYLYTSCLVLGEVKKGIELLPEGARKAAFADSLDKVMQSFDGRIVDVSSEISLLWGELVAKAQLSGWSVPPIDAILAAQCIQNNLVLVTRNLKDFNRLPDLQILCPWE